MNKRTFWYNIYILQQHIKNIYYHTPCTEKYRKSFYKRYYINNQPSPRIISEDVFWFEVCFYLVLWKVESMYLAKQVYKSNKNIYFTEPLLNFFFSENMVSWSKINICFIKNKKIKEKKIK